MLDLSDPWWRSRYTGLFTQLGAVPARPHDPPVHVHAGTARGPRGEVVAGGAGLDARAAELACVGEAIERLDARPLARDAVVVARHDRWPLDEPAVAPGRFVLFHPEQHARPGFPFAPLRADAEVAWTCLRRADDGRPVWAPEELVALGTRDGAPHRLAPAPSTGLSCGRAGHPALLRGLQEVVERDAVVGAWWGRYRLEEHDPAGALDPAWARPNLTWRCYRLATPFAAHATLVTCAGEDREGFVFSVGAAVRETRAASWGKAALEAVQGRHYVRFLRAQGPRPAGPPRDFAGHALHYSLHPEELAATPLARPVAAGDHEAARVEPLPALLERLGPERPALFRAVTPPDLASELGEWVVLRVLVPGLQPLHGDHLLPFLGGPLWAPRGLAEWASTPPHPMP